MSDTIYDYLSPDIEDIVAKICVGLVPEEKIGTTRREVFPMYEDFSDNPMYDVEEEVDGYSIEDFDYIIVRRMMGYITEDSFTDMSGVEIRTFSKDSARANCLMAEITKRLQRAQGEYFKARALEADWDDSIEDQEWLVDYTEVLNGPTEDYLKAMDDRSVEKNFEIHVRVKWL